MAKSDRRRWWDWRINQTSGQSIRRDDKGSSGAGKKKGAKNGWWWTLAAREGECMSCGKQLLHQKIAYHYYTRRILCPECATAEQIADMCQPSRKLLKVGS